MLLSLSALAFADEFGVQIISRPEEETAETSSLDDMKIEEEVEIDGYGIVTVKSFDIVDDFYRWNKNQTSHRMIESGDDADFALMYLSIINTATTARSFARECEVKLVFDEIYEYGGWIIQAKSYSDAAWRGLNEADYYAIEPLYEGCYMIGGAIPNYVVNNKKPLAMIITIDGNEMTYNIRK